jgi:hypothetical protein
MKMIELKTPKGGTVWVNPGQVLYIAQPESAESTMYADSRERQGAKLFFVQGTNLEVRESPAEVVSRIGD